MVVSGDGESREMKKYFGLRAQNFPLHMGKLINVKIPHNHFLFRSFQPGQKELLLRILIIHSITKGI